MTMIRSAATAALALATSAASAQITSEDDAIFGVDSITRDAAQQLDFLDLTLSTNISYNEMITQFGTGGDFEGWRHATSNEVITLINNAGFDPFLQPDDGTFEVNAIFGTPGVDSMSTLVDLVGELFDQGSFRMTEGITATSLDFGFGPRQRVVNIQDTVNPASGETVRLLATAPTSASDFTGHWLVRPVPAPSTAALLGVAGLAATRRRR
ncbi:MAG: PEP-CTERM sorting domain-containing protein [Phycisphaerales bacterium]